MLFAIATTSDVVDRIVSSALHDDMAYMSSLCMQIDEYVSFIAAQTNINAKVRC